jgi:hypothetical protein
LVIYYRGFIAYSERYQPEHEGPEILLMSYEKLHIPGSGAKTVQSTGEVPKANIVPHEKPILMASNNPLIRASNRVSNRSFNREPVRELIREPIRELIREPVREPI